MKKTYFLHLALLLAAVSAPATMKAEVVNLLDKAYSHPEGIINNSDDFYDVWLANYASGQSIPSEKLPVSVFNQITIHEGLPAYYKGISIEASDGLAILPGSATAEEFPEGMQIMIPGYPGQDSYADCFYSIPISVPSAGTYTLSGSMDFNTYLNTAQGYVYSFKQVVFVGSVEPSSGLAEMKIESDNGTYYLKVTDNAGHVLPCVNVSVFDAQNAAVCQKFSKAIELTPDTKYLSIYAPACQEFILGALQLTGDVSIVDSVTAMNAEDAPVRVFDLSGRQVSASGSDLPAGVYIIRQGSETRKIMTDNR